jgi:hypothetical protein
VPPGVYASRGHTHLPELRAELLWGNHLQALQLLLVPHGAHQREAVAVGEERLYGLPYLRMHNMHPDLSKPRPNDPALCSQSRPKGPVTQFRAESDNASEESSP